MSHPNTIKVKPWSAEQGEHVVINEDDFDSKVHEIFEEPAKESKSQIKRKAALSAGE